MTRLFLAAGVAALAISAPATAKPGGGHGGDNKGQARVQAPQGGGHGGGQRFQAQSVERHGGGGGGQRFQAQSFERHGGGGGGPRFQAQSIERHGGGHGQSFAFVQHQDRQQVREQRQQPRLERQQMRVERQQPRIERQQMRVERQAQNRGFEHQQMRLDRQQLRAERQQIHGNELRQAQNRGMERQQIRAERQQLRDNRLQQVNERALARQQFDQDRFARNEQLAQNRAEQFRVNHDFENRYYGSANARGLIDGCPPGLWAKNNGCMPPGQAAKLFGAPLATAAGYGSLAALPRTVSYLYPDTNDYYYRYGNGYLYQVDRNTNLIGNLFPLMAGGYLPGQYLPASYMNSYVPDYYGLNSFYPDYGNTCNRYGYGVVYEVDCYSGVVYNAVPLYAGGYGVGQMLPSSYAYYNVPYQYRTMYYDTPEYNYWYAPGAIYQYDPQSSMITSVAALLSPGFTVGQQLPMGYDVYNVPYGYRSTYYDTPNAMYRYNNGYIYQVDPVTRLVTAIVASLLT